MAESEREALDAYIRKSKVEEAAQELVQCLLQAKPDNPREWLLEHLEQELSDESEDLSESELHKLFAVTRKITAEIVPEETIQIIISETLQLLNCETVSLFLVDRRTGMLRLYASNMEQPVVTSSGQGIVGSVFTSRETVNIPDCSSDRRFDSSVDSTPGCVARSLLAVPLVDFDGSSKGVIRAVNKMPARRGDKQESSVSVPFRRNDQRILQHLAEHVGIAVRNAEVYREAIGSSERATGLLNTIQSLSQDLGTQSMLLTITMHANKIVSSERSTVFLVDEANDQLWSVSTDTGEEIRIPKKAGIAGLCCTQGQLINIPDAYADSRFNQEVDKKTGFRTQSLLAVPMLSDSKMDSEGKPLVIGVIQMINKVSYDGRYECFDEADVEIMELFAKFVGPKLTTSSTLARRSFSKHASEAQFALGNAAEALNPKNRLVKARVSGAGNLQAFGEEEEDAED